MKKTKSRKLEHLDVCVKKNVETGGTLFDDVRFVHHCLPEMAMEDVNTKTVFLKKKFNAPIMVAAITGGVAKAGKINRDIASVAEKLGIGFGLGSQRAMLEDVKVIGTYQVRDVAPNIMVLGNIGAAQLGDYNALEIKKAMQDVGADAMCVHLNPAQEAAQAEGDHDFNDVLKNIGILSKTVPIIAKEIGNGISRECAIELRQAGVMALDIGGHGGTSWVKVDSIRAKKEGVFNDWGIPTAAGVMECSGVLPCIATGGIRNGLEIAKAIALGAEIVGVSLPVLRWYSKGGKKAVENGFQQMISELKMAMFLTGSRNILELKSTNMVISGQLRDWADSRGISVEHYGYRGIPHTVIG